MCEPTDVSAANTRRKRSEPIQLCPLERSIKDKAISVSSPIFSANTMASQAPTRLIPASRLFTSFTLAPSPTRWLMRTHLSDKVCNKASWADNTAAGAASIRLMVPLAARSGPPDIGASTMATPMACNCLSKLSVCAGAMVGHMITVCPFVNPDNSPSEPANTCSTSTASITHTITTSVTRATSAALPWPCAPTDCKASCLVVSKSWTCTCQPVCNKRWAMPAPMLPVPTIPTGFFKIAPIV